MHSDKASNPREAINRALTHLEAAHVAFRKAWTDGSFVRRSNSELNALRDAWVCSLIAICHKFLGDDSSLIQKALSEAKLALDYEANEEFRATMLFDLVNPLRYADLAIAHKDWIELRPIQTQFDEFSLRVLLP